MILVVDVCKEKLHSLEFVRPVEDLIEGEFVTKHYLDLDERDLEKAGKVIICGTALADFGYLNNLEKFDWLKEFDKPVLGICAGAQIMGMVFGGKLVDDLKIGQVDIKLEKDALGFKEGRAYFLHKKRIELERDVAEEIGEDWSVFKLKKKDFWGLSFHPEVLNKEIVRSFAS